MLRNVINNSNSSNDAPLHHPKSIHFANECLATSKMRHASTSTLDLLNTGENGDDEPKHDNYQCAITTKTKSNVSNKLDFNNFFGMMRKGKDMCSNKKSALVVKSDAQSKSPSAHHGHSHHRVGRLKPAKNVYFIDDQKDDEPNIFIIDAESINKHKRVHYERKSMEDIFNQSRSENYRKSFDDEHEHEPWNFASRTSYASRTLPRDFCRRNARAALHNVFDNYHHHQTNHQVER